VWPPHFHFARQIDSIHDTGKPDVSKNHGHVLAAQEHGCKRSFGAFGLNDVEFTFLQHDFRQLAQFSVIFDNQSYPLF
jgi:hypothetical protein